MKSNTHIAVILDRSGSMESMRKEIIGGFNAFLEDQKKVPGSATMTLVQFDHEIDRLATFKPLSDVAALTSETYVPRGCTKLYDAIGLTVNTVKDEVAKAADKPDKILVVILTDGMENSSQEYDTAGISALLEERQKAGWEFSFIGANQDAILTARGIGLKNAASNLTYAATPDGAINMMASLSTATASFRCAAKGTSFAYAEQDRAAQFTDPSSAYSQASKATFSENGHLAGKLGGHARANSLTPNRRSTIARNAAKARWSKESV
jgi:uncharacterized protein YegL